MAEAILMPRLNFNDEYFIIEEWKASNGDFIRRGDVLCIVETSKALVEVTSEKSGYLSILVQESSKVRENEIICYLLESKGEKVPENFKIPVILTEAKVVRATKKAKALAGKLGIDLSEIKADRIIRERDIDTFIDEKQKKEKQSETPVYEVTLKVNTDRLIDKEFLEDLLRDYEEKGEFGKLSSDKKIDIYRSKGALIGKNVRIEKGSYIISQYIQIGDGTTIGKDSIFQAKAMRIGTMCRFGNQLRIATTVLDIGDLLYTDNEVKIGEGGEWGRDSVLKIGDACFIGEGCMINTSKPVIIGDNVCLAYGSKIFTHSFWQSALKGYPVLYNSVKIDDGVIVGVNVAVMPGVNIGNGAIILTNSIVLSNVPKGSIYGGVPAAMIKPEGFYPVKLSENEEDKIISEAIKELAEDLSFRKHNIRIIEQDSIVKLLWLDEDVSYTYIRSFKKYNLAEAYSSKRNIFLVFENSVSKLEDNMTIFDLRKEDVKGKQDIYSDEIREILRKRGIKFKPILWRYKRRSQWLEQTFPQGLMK